MLNLLFCRRRKPAPTQKSTQTTQIIPKTYTEMGDMCVICLEPMVVDKHNYENSQCLIIGQCAHMFHDACLTPKTRESCAICRQQFSSPRVRYTAGERYNPTTSERYSRYRAFRDAY